MEGQAMSTAYEQPLRTPLRPEGIGHKLWREASRPVRRIARRLRERSAPRGASIADFHPHRATVEAEGIPLIKKLVRDAAAHPGPIVEVGTLLGVTTTTMALAKAPQQKIITVDLYCWNPWGLTPDAHAALTAQVLHYLVETGHVERVRMDKNDFYRTYRGPAPSLAFLDAMHDYEETKKDIEWARRIGAATIAGHDYCDEFPGVKRIVDEMGGPRELAGSVWVL
jgi:hypothetical protein